MKRWIYYAALLLLGLLCTFRPGSAMARVMVCVLDSGCDLPGIQGWNYLDESEDLTDATGHGTAICSLLLACAPEVEARMLKCFASEASVEEDAVVRAVYAAVDDYQADIILMCWTVGEERQALLEATRYAFQQGVVLLAPTGNLSLSTGLHTTVYPAAWEEVIGIGGVNLNDAGEPVASLWYLSGEAVYVCARADAGKEKGTSFAVPRVAAAVAGFLEEAPQSTMDDLLRMLREAARDVGEPGYDTTYGWGYIESDT